MCPEGFVCPGVCVSGGVQGVYPGVSVQEVCVSGEGCTPPQT